MSRYLVQVDEGDGTQGPPSINWRPWDNVTDADELKAMAAQKYIRERGGWVGVGVLTVWTWKEGAPTHANGLPICVMATTFNLQKVET